MRKALSTALVLSSFAVGLLAQGAPEGSHVILSPARGVALHTKGLGTAPTNHGGPVITAAHVVFIFWGPNFANAASADHIYATTLQAYRNQFGTTPEFNVITQYSGSNGTVGLSNLAGGTADWFDTSTPPANVTDAIAQGKVNTYLASHTFDANAIYEVVLPSSSYSSMGGVTSCGGPKLVYCAYHGSIGSGTSAKKYSVQPYPSCGGCQVSGWSAVQNQEHFVCHETREAVTDPVVGTGWVDGSNELDDLCAWSPTPFFGTGGYGYQYEWSNAAGGCVQSLGISSTCTAVTAFVSGPSSEPLHVSSTYTASFTGSVASPQYWWSLRFHSTTTGWGSWSTPFQSATSSTTASLNSCGYDQFELKVEIRSAGCPSDLGSASEVVTITGFC